MGTGGGAYPSTYPWYGSGAMSHSHFPLYGHWDHQNHCFGHSDTQKPPKSPLFGPLPYSPRINVAPPVQKWWFSDPGCLGRVVRTVSWPYPWPLKFPDFPEMDTKVHESARSARISVPCMLGNVTISDFRKRENSENHGFSLFPNPYSPSGEKVLILHFSLFSRKSAKITKKVVKKWPKHEKVTKSLSR